MTTPPSHQQLDDEQLRLAIRRTLELAASRGLQPSPGLHMELQTLQGLQLVPATMTVEQLRTVWASVERELEDEVHASRASRRVAL